MADWARSLNNQATTLSMSRMYLPNRNMIYLKTYPMQLLEYGFSVIIAAAQN